MPISASQSDASNTAGSFPASRNPLVPVLCALLLLNSAVLYSIAADAPQTLIATVVGLIAAAALKRGASPSTRMYVYSGVTALVAGMIDVQFFPVESARFFILPADVYGPLLLYLGVALLIPAHRASSYTAVAAMGLIVLTLTGNATSQAPENVRFPWSSNLADDFLTLYAVGTAFALVCLALLCPRIMSLGVQKPATRRHHQWMRTALILVAFGAMGGFTIGSRELVQRCEPALGRLLNMLIRQYGERRSDQVVFGRQVDLWRTLPYRSYQNRTPVIRVLSSIPPGYMRGRVYTHYNNGRWTQGENEDERMLAQSWPEGQRIYTIFDRPLPRPDGPVRSETMVVLPASRHETDVLLAPPAGRRFEMVADEMREDSDGALFHKGWKQNSGCRILTNIHEDAYPFPSPVPAPPSRHTQVPSTLRLHLDSKLQTLELESERDIPDAQRMAETVQHLQRTCSYKLGIGLKSTGEDPVLQFVDDRRQGHCELFASAAALLLRSQGVPTRYVTGFVCVEQAAGKYWLARLRDAHAWVEAYDRQAKRWKLVEATPAAGVPSEQDSPAWLRTLLDAPLTAWQWVRYHVSRGDFAQAVYALVGTVLYAVRGFLTTLPGGGLVIALLGIYLWRRIHIRQKRRNLHHPLPFDRELNEARTILLRSLRRKGVNRRTGETIGELIKRSSATIPDENLPHLQQVAEIYQFLRFCPDARSATQVAELLKTVRDKSA